jgi:hypothetical protein
MSQSAWQRWKEANRGNAKPWDMLNPNVERAPEDVAEKRLSICLSCDRFMKITRTCKECGCLMDAKTKIGHAFCPLGKWSEHKSNV